MLYREFGKTKEKLSILGFGCMRLPIIGKDSARIDEEEAIRQIRYGIDQGINYIDTAYPYHGGMSEIVVGKALKDGYREKIRLATKLPSWLIKTEEDMVRILNEQLEKLQVDHIDFYLVHALNKEDWDKLRNLHLFSFLEKAREEGKIRYLGFSFHDELSVFKEIVDSYDWDFCQIQYNFMDVAYQAGKAGLEYAYNKGLGVVIMEPLRGGSLVKNVPEDIKALWDTAEIKRSPVEWAFRFIWNHREVGVVLSGMNEIVQLEENIRSTVGAYPGHLTEKEEALIDQVKEIYISRIAVNCTACRYCMPCPFGVDIPGNFVYLNNAFMYQDVDNQKYLYNTFMSEESKAKYCRECGRCEKLCPQNIPIIHKLKQVTDVLGV